ncbi:TetR/AcrR family transcriptional regulator C-terminal domain-containing protein [Alloscardovia macacae]|uniref:Transcriptional regulator n=1 Tax=Alloscardovia macacae TaxID=1160091 RepID=A0A261F3N4_9BIFI|nr:TetR/AcrR family transcriptional regulator C-terminal domain-containing protein [Alloscardovia macacae]OZG53701.1 transcriptional regulator [Alloscardovia macacae]
MVWEHVHYEVMKNEESSLLTKTQLAESLKKAMSDKPLSKITVSALVADSHVNRKTFYYHFADINALLEWMLYQEAVQVVAQFDLVNDYEDAIRFVVHYVQENTHILNCAYDTLGREGLKNFFYYDFTALMTRIISEREKELRLSGRVPQEFEKFLCHFFTEAIAGMLVNGFKGLAAGEMDDSERSVDAVIAHFSVVMETLPDMLRRGVREE